MTAPTVPYSCSVQFFGSGIKSPSNGPKTLEITQQEFAHDVATCLFWGGDVDSDSLLSGTPILITFGRPSVRRVFYGYVNHAKRVTSSLANTQSLTDRNAVSVVCVGASWPLKQTDTKVYMSHTASQVVQLIATQFHLAANIVPDTTVWPTLQMAGRSYFQFCVWLAQKIGYTFYCNGAQLVFKPRQTNPSSLASLAAIFDYHADPNGLLSFVPTVGATSPGGGQLVNRTLVGINPRTTKVVRTTVSGSPTPTTLGAAVDAPIFDKTEHFTVNSQQEADAKTNGAAALNQLYITATGYASGNPLISQGSLVVVQNANGSQNGLWFVTKVEHCQDTRTYSMNLWFGRDSRGTSKGISTVIQTKNPPVAKLVNGIWSAK